MAKQRNIVADKPDWIILFSSMALVLIGIIMIYSASGVTTEEKYYFVFRQTLFAIVGYVVACILIYTPRQLFYKIHYIVLGISIILLLLVFTPLGLSINGARRWISIAGFSVQPMEFVRIAVVFYLAYFISTKTAYRHSFVKGFMPMICVIGILSILLVLQPDFGGAIFFALLLLSMAFVGGISKVYLGVVSVGSCIVGLLLIFSSPYRMKRVLSFLDPFQDSANTGYQIVQSLYAVASGGFWGLGLGEGKQKLYYLPEAHNDFIFAVIAEELGFIGVSVIFALYTVIFLRAFRVLLLQTTLQARLLVFGVTLILMLSTFFNIGVVVALFPPKGIALPLLSYGGSSLLASCICLGIIVRFSYSIEEK